MPPSTPPTKRDEAARCKARALGWLADADASGVLYNPTFLDIKRALDRALESALDAHEAEQSRARQRVYYEYELWRLTLHTLPAFSKRIEKAKRDGADIDVAALEALVAEYLPLRERLEAWKPRVKKGRQPAPDPKTPPRTLINTGTCAVCLRNVKRDGNGSLVDHGYQVSDHGRPLGFRNGGCPGVGFSPWECSPAGAQAFVATLKQMREVQSRLLLKLPEQTKIVARDFTGQERLYTRGEAGFEPALALATREIESDIAHLSRLIADYESRIAGWKPQPLP